MNVAVKNVPYYDEEGFDSYIFDDDHKLVGIFDGMGTSEDARNAAKLCANLIFKERSTGPNAIALGALIDQASRSIAVSFPNGGTTAVVARVDSKGDLHYASIGDSRLYVLKDKRVKQMTADEGINNQLLNYCGPLTRGCVQIGEIHADDWDKFMLCSDGITGDWREQQIGDHLIEITLAEMGAAAACEKLYQLSKKDDDKTVIVVEK